MWLQVRPTWVVDAGLDDVVQGEAAGRLLVAQLGVHVQRQNLGHVVVVLAEVGELLLRRVVHLKLVVSVSERHDDVWAADLDPQIITKPIREELGTVNNQSNHKIEYFIWSKLLILF